MDVKWPTFRRTVLEAGAPFMKLIGKFHTPPHYRGVTDLDAASILDRARPGDVLLSHRDSEITNGLIPGYWKHAAFYEGSGRVIEAIGRGVIDNSLLEFCTTKDAVILMRSKFASAEECLLAVDSAKSLRGKPYDYLVEPETLEQEYGRKVNDAFYCSEVIWWSYDDVLKKAGKKSPFTPVLTLGVPTITPQDIYNAEEKWERVVSVGGNADKWERVS